MLWMLVIKHQIKLPFPVIETRFRGYLWFLPTELSLSILSMPCLSDLVELLEFFYGCAWFASFSSFSFADRYIFLLLLAFGFVTYFVFTSIFIMVIGMLYLVFSARSNVSQNHFRSMYWTYVWRDCIFGAVWFSNYCSSFRIFGTVLGQNFCLLRRSISHAYKVSLLLFFFVPFQLLAS